MDARENERNAMNKSENDGSENEETMGDPRPTLHIYNVHRGGSIGRLKVTPKMRKAFPTCNCGTFEVHRYYDCSTIFHRPKCKWLWYNRRLHARSRVVTSWMQEF